MVKKTEIQKKEILIATYMRVRKSFESICDDRELPTDEYLQKFPVAGLESLSREDIKNLTNNLNRDLRLLIKGLCLTEWQETIRVSFDKDIQEEIIEYIQEAIKCDPSNAYVYFSKINDILKVLNNKDTKGIGLSFFERYCENNSFEDLVNDYDLVFKSIHASEVSAARDKGWQNQRNQNFGKRKREKYMNYFNASEKSKGEREELTQPGIE